MKRLQAFRGALEACAGQQPKRQSGRRLVRLATINSILEPPGDDAYTTAPRDGTAPIEVSLDRTCASFATLRVYWRMLRHTACTRVGPGLVGRGLFVCEDVEPGRLLVEYVGNRVSGTARVRMEREMDRRGVEPDVQVEVPSDCSVIDPRGCGNASMFVNHCCSPNAWLQEYAVGDKHVVFITALVRIPKGTEVFIDYGYYSAINPGSFGRRTILICACPSPNCRGSV